MAYGFALFFLSFIDIKEEAAAEAEAAREAALAAAEEEGAPAGDAAAAQGEEGGVPAGPPVDTDPSVYELIMGSSGAQKINFANNIMVFLGQGLKNVFDIIAAKQLEQVIAGDAYVDMTTLFLFNKFVMFMDSMIICVSSVSLLKYTIAAVPDLEIIQLSILSFIKNTFAKTFTLVFLAYQLFGQMSNYVLSVYQYGFAQQLYALLRSCIIFMGGFVINEQTVFYSFESVENLQRMNTFGVTIFTIIVLNILIRQIMINLVAIFMHNDYHNAKLLFAELEQERAEKTEAKIML
jgi:hypothetical protein